MNIVSAIALSLSVATVSGEISKAIPIELASAFITAELALISADTCATALGKDSARSDLDAQIKRFAAYHAEAQGIWGKPMLDVQADLTGKKVDCRAQPFERLVTLAKADLDKLFSQLQRQTEPYDKGVWFGTLSLCGSLPVKAEMVIDDFGADAILVTLDDERSSQLVAMTTANVGHPLALRSNGIEVMRPIVHEPVVEGQIYIVSEQSATLTAAFTTLEQCSE